MADHTDIVRDLRQGEFIHDDGPSVPLYQSFDSWKWARAFVRTKLPGKTPAYELRRIESEMEEWFANAMLCGFVHAVKVGETPVVFHYEPGNAKSHQAAEDMARQFNRRASIATPVTFEGPSRLSQLRKHECGWLHHEAANFCGGCGVKLKVHLGCWACGALDGEPHWEGCTRMQALMDCADAVEEKMCGPDGPFKRWTQADEDANAAIDKAASLGVEFSQNDAHKLTGITVTRTPLCDGDGNVIGVETLASGHSQMVMAVTDGDTDAPDHEQAIAAANAKHDPYAIGELVRLNSGGPVMAVEGPGKEPGKLRCRWTKPSGLVEHGDFDRECVEAVECQ